MRKAVWLLMLFAVISLVGVSAQGVSSTHSTTTIWTSAYQNIIKPVFFNLGSVAGGNSTEEAVIFLRLAFALLLFAALYAASELALGDMAKNSRVAITFTISIISVVLMPNDVLQGVAQTYGILFFGFLLAIPIAGGTYLLFTHFHEKTRGNYLAKGSIAIIMSALLGYFSQSLPAFVHGPRAIASVGLGDALTSIANFIQTTASLADFVGGVLLIAGIWWFVGRGLLGVRTTDVTSTPVHAFGGRRPWYAGPGNWGGLPQGTRYVRELRDQAGEVINNIVTTAAAANNIADVRMQLGLQNQILTSVGNILTELSATVATADATRRATLDPLIAELKRANMGIRTELVSLSRHVNLPAGAGGAIPPPNWAQINAHAGVLRGHFDDALTAVETLSRLIKQ